jgi:hypothetical protein
VAVVLALIQTKQIRIYINETIQNAQYKQYKMHSTNDTKCTVQTIQNAQYKLYKMHSTNNTKHRNTNKNSK